MAPAKFDFKKKREKEKKKSKMKIIEVSSTWLIFDTKVVIWNKGVIS